MRAIFVFFGLVTAACSASSTDVAMKEIVFRGELVRFQIPKDWMEEYGPEGGGIFYGNYPDAGTLRLDIITAESPKNLGPEEPFELIRGIKGVDVNNIRHLPNSNAMASKIIHTSERGTPITMYWWYLSNFVPPKHVRLANFSYTVLTSQEHDEKTISEVRMLAKSIEQAEFHPTIGE